MTGQCCCGAVRFEGRAVRNVVVCHCSKCRRWHGHAGAYTRFPQEGFRFLEDRGLAWYQVSPTARRGFCRECGSGLFFEDLRQRTLSVCAGSLDAPTGLTTAAHIYVGSKGDYYAAPTDAPAYDELPPPKA